MIKSKKIKELIRTCLIILGIYILFVVYLLFVSERMKKLDNRSLNDNVYYSLKIG